MLPLTTREMGLIAWYEPWINLHVSSAELGGHYCTLKLRYYGKSDSGPCLRGIDNSKPCYVGNMNIYVVNIIIR